MVTRKHKTPLYDIPFTIVIYDNDAELQRKFKKWEFDHPIDSFDGGVFEIDGMNYIVFSAEKIGYPTPGIIAHEAKHLVNDIYIAVGCELDPHNDEPEAYLLMWIVDRVHGC